MDGERMANDAGGEMAKLLEFLEVPEQKFTFENQRNKGFSCLQQPLPFCLNPAKGTSRKSDIYKIFPHIARNALNHMKDEMRHNLPLLGFADYEEQVDICLGVADRFKWYKRFVCPLPLPDNDYSASMNYPSYYDEKSSEDEIITNVVNRNLDPPFIENKHEIRMNHDNDQNDEVVYRMNKLTMGGD